MKKSFSRAFSLIELSIVVLIIGILIAGVTQGSRLVRQSKIATANSLTKSSDVNSIDGLALWLEATDFRSFGGEANDGDTINTWYDINSQSITANNATSAAGPTYSSNSYNGLPTLAFNGSSNYLLNSNITSTFSNNNSFSVFVVFKANDLTSTQTIVANRANASSSNDQWGLVITSNTLKCAMYNGTSYFTGYGGAYNSTGFNVASIVYSNYNVSLYLNGVKYTSVFNSNTGSGGANFTIGRRSDSTAYLNGNIGEIIGFNRAVKASEQSSIEKYLSKKWGLGF